MIFYFVDLYSSFLSNLPKSLIPHLNFLSDLIKFEEYFKNTLIICGFDPYSPLYSLIIDYNLKLVILKKI